MIWRLTGIAVAVVACFWLAIFGSAAIGWLVTR